MGDTTFGPYRLLVMLGQGGMGEVWRALDTRKDRQVALKILGSWVGTDPDYARRFRREAALAARLNAPNIVPIHDYGEIDGQLFIDMPLVDGTDLQGLLERDGPLAPARAVGIIDQVADALDVAHAAGLVHRDVKPSNVLVTHPRADRDFAYLIDFGIARALDGTKTSQTGALIGTPAYMAPERFSGEGDRRGDVYALAAMFYTALTARPPFEPPRDAQLVGYVYAHLHSPPPQPSRQVAGISAAFDSVIARGMAKHPEARYRSAGDLATAARAALTSGSAGGNALHAGADPETAVVPTARAATPPRGRVVAANRARPPAADLLDRRPVGGSAATAPGQPDPPPPPSVPPPRRRRRGPSRPALMLGAGATALATVAGLLFAVDGWPFAGASNLTGGATPGPPSTPGTCLTWTQPEASDAAVVDCAQPHLLEQAGSVNLADQAALPDDQQWVQLVDAGCGPVVTGYLNGKLDPDGRYRIGALKPSATRWRDGDREMRCGLQRDSVSGALYPTTGKVADSDQSHVDQPGTCLGIDGRGVGDPSPCDVPHAVEVIGVVDLAQKFTAGFPAVTDQDAYLQPTCTRIASDYAGGDNAIATAKLTVYWDNITQASWKVGSRKVNCNVAALLPDRSGFAPVTGSVKTTVTVGTKPGAPATRQPGVPG